MEYVLATQQVIKRVTSDANQVNINSQHLLSLYGSIAGIYLARKLFQHHGLGWVLSLHGILLFPAKSQEQLHLPLITRSFCHSHFAPHLLPALSFHLSLTLHYHPFQHLLLKCPFHSSVLNHCFLFLFPSPYWTPVD
jgi:hypothetical protein